jgi:hypothetical protein
MQLFQVCRETALTELLLIPYHLYNFPTRSIRIRPFGAKSRQNFVAEFVKDAVHGTLQWASIGFGMCARRKRCVAVIAEGSHASGNIGGSEAVG